MYQNTINFNLKGREVLNVEIIEHKYQHLGLLHHTSLIKTDWKDDTGDKDELVEEVSSRVGFHKLGYGIYGDRIIEKQGNDNYLVKWQTGTHCE